MFTKHSFQLNSVNECGSKGVKDKPKQNRSEIGMTLFDADATDELKRCRCDESGSEP